MKQTEVHYHKMKKSVQTEISESDPVKKHVLVVSSGNLFQEDMVSIHKMIKSNIN